MTTDVDWQHEIDASFGTATDVPVDRYVAAGHRAVRRRRLTTVAGGLAVAGVVGAVAWGAAPDRDPASPDVPVAIDRSSPASPAPTSADEVPAQSWRKGDPPARSGPAGLEIRDGAVVHERRDDLFPAKDSESAALDISWGGERWWMTLEWDGGGGGSASVQPGDGLFDSFDAFVRAEVAGGGMTSEPAGPDDDYLGGLVRWDGVELDTRPGVVVVRRVEDPVADRRSLGLVLRKDGTTTWMLVYRDGASWTEESLSGWSGFDDWLADQVALEGGAEPAEVPVSLSPDATVVAGPGARVIEQQADPDLRAYGTEADGATSAVALVAWRGQRWFVLLIGDSVSPVAVSKAGGARTLEEFVAFMADRADEGGVR
ncbi:hypothetical protein SAMN04489844_0990 [Nocardioides exalbidus]|uniref:Uncharacterized protein n=1 Tax=Nocardioides exalbidus TaxID=402596 RepID=A0A1H4LXS6_9ACTN|nr:hypothetical protein [Nocardioides exalbidus]SEB75388.1 hypothetical protein SAMN04489844_0990 [Nocardioides exalbidus]